MRTAVMTLRALGSRIQGLSVPNWVQFMLDDHRPDILVEVEFGDPGTPNPYSNIRAIRRLTRD